jgi:hypothetical protein
VCTDDNCGQIDENWQDIPASATSVLALVGNIVEDRPYGPGGEEVRHGTRLFRPNAKVYLSSLQSSLTINITAPRAKLDYITVVGQHRKSRKWIESWIDSTLVINWRIQVVYKPGAVQRLREANWPGFQLEDSEFELGEDRNSEQVLKAFLAALKSERCQPKSSR